MGVLLLAFRHVVGLKIPFSVFSRPSRQLPLIRIRTFVLIPFMEYDVLFPSNLKKFFTLVFEEGGSSFATHCFAICRGCFDRLRVCSSDSSSLSACVKKYFFQRRHARKMRSLQWVLFGYLLGFWDVSFPRLWVSVWRECQPQCWLNKRCALFWKWIVTPNQMLSPVLVELLSFEKNVYQIC